ncbi:hypothetical protein ZIOFF_028407 [Zingiber officinale]|uniref:Uncharacterized protein n=1 Tax=Zingiber officinale TaxID=94328 RepID=A0A8J5GPT2_ZINOF|nr:hypothetical protein ZIOFF_028407 [Zingiber officinale]
MASLLSPSASLLGRDRLHLAYPSASPRRAGLHRLQPIKAFSSADPPKETPAKTTTEATKPPAPSPPKKPVYSMKKGQIVRVDKEKYLSSINVLVLAVFGDSTLACLSDSTLACLSDSTLVCHFLGLGSMRFCAHLISRSLHVKKGFDLKWLNISKEVYLRANATSGVAQVAWVGIPTAPAWLPTYMLIKVLVSGIATEHLCLFKESTVRRNSIMREYDLGGDLASCINGNKKWKNFAKVPAVVLVAFNGW